MRHSPELVSGFCTMAIEWIHSTETEPPEWMRHAPEIITSYGTMATAWIRSSKTEPPEWMRHAPEIITKEGTMAMTWVNRIKTNPPEWMWHNPGIRDKNGRTIQEYWEDRENIPEWMIYKIFTEMKIGCSHSKEIATSSKMIVCNNCGTGEKVFCDDVCPICREDYEEGMDVGVFDVCKHVFCKECATSWIAYKTSCPYCKR
jgi:hypothetical protein